MRTIEALESQIQRILKAFGFVDFAILFGSFAENKANSMSDLDMGIHTGKEISLLELGGLIEKLESGVGIKTDVIQLNSLYKTDPLFTFEIVSKGKLLFCSNKEEFVCFKKNVLLYYLDMKDFFEMFDKSFAQRLEQGKFAERNYEG